MKFVEKKGLDLERTWGERKRGVRTARVEGKGQGGPLTQSTSLPLFAGVGSFPSPSAEPSAPFLPPSPAGERSNNVGWRTSRPEEVDSALRKVGGV